MIDKHIKNTTNQLKNSDITCRKCFYPESGPAKSIIVNALIKLYDNNLCVLMNEQRHDGEHLKYQCLKSGKPLTVCDTSVISGMKPDAKFVIYLNDVTDGVIRHAITLTDTQMQRCITRARLTQAYKQATEEMTDIITISNVDDVVLQYMQSNWNSHTESCAMKKLRELYFALLGDDFSNITFNTEQKCITIYTAKHLGDVIETLFADCIQKVKKSFLNEDLEIGYPSVSSTTRVILGAGGVTREVLLPAQSRCVLIRKTGHDVMVRDHVIKKMERYGPVSKVDEYNGDDDMWGKVTFETSVGSNAALADSTISSSMLLQSDVYQYEDKATLSDNLYTIISESSFCAHASRQRDPKENLHMEMKAFADRIVRRLETTMPSGRAKVKMHIPRPDDDYIKCTVIFPEFHLLSSGEDAVKGGKVNPINVTSVHGNHDNICPTFSLQINKKLYALMNEQIHQINADCKSAVTCTRVSDTADVKLTYECSDVVPLHTVKRKLNAVLYPKQIQISRKQNKRLSQDSVKLHLKYVELANNVLITVQVNAVSIYGSQTNGASVQKHIKGYLDTNTAIWHALQLDDINSIEARKVVDMVQDSKADFETNHITHVNYWLEKNVLLFEGILDSSKVIEMFLSKKVPLIKSISSVTNQPVEDDMCAVCLCPIEGISFTPQTCKHTFCMGCIRQNVEVAITNGTFPVVCPHCSEEMCLRDLYKLGESCSIDVRKLAEKSLNTFVEANPAYSYCSGLRCNGVCIDGDASADYIPCSTCLVEHCKLCKLNRHTGETCDEHQQKIFHILQWQREDPKNHKLCPKCNMPIEKTGGCNNVYCSFCHTSICWQCLASFSASDACYNHMANENHHD